MVRVLEYDVSLLESSKNKTCDPEGNPINTFTPNLHLLNGLSFPQVVSQCLQFRTHLFLGWGSLICRQLSEWSGHVPFSLCRCASCSPKSQWGRTHLCDHAQYSGVWGLHELSQYDEGLIPTCTIEIWHKIIIINEKQLFWHDGYCLLLRTGKLSIQNPITWMRTATPLPLNAP